MLNQISRRGLLIGSAAAATGAAAPGSTSPVRCRAVGGFIGERLRRNVQNRIRTFDVDRYVAMVEEKKHRDWWWIGEQPGKWLEAAIESEEAMPDAAVRKKAEQVLARLIAAQDADGYVGITDPALRTARHPFRGMDPYELYFTLHAFLTAHEEWGNEAALRAARRLGDFFVANVAPGKAEFWPLPKPVTIAGHEVHYGLEGTLLLDPVMRLYQRASDRKYLEWSKWVMGSIDRWSVSDTFSNLDKVAAGAMHLNQIQPNVHSHTLHMNLIGFLRMYQVTNDPALLAKVQGAVRDVMESYTYITGAVSVAEGYKEPHALPNTGELAETCASMSWIRLNQMLLGMTQDAKHADAIERLLWNHLLAAQAIDGDGFRYHCALNGWKPRAYFTGPDCCSSSGALILAKLPGIIYGARADGVAVHQYVDSAAEFRTGGTLVKVVLSGGYPTREEVRIEVAPERAVEFALHLRMPGWCGSPEMSVNGERVRDPKPGTYAAVRRKWSAGDRVELRFPMRTAWVEGSYSNQGLKALTRGPLVYALDTAWMPAEAGDAIGGDGKSDNLPGVAGVEREWTAAATPAGALGPAYAVGVRLAGGGQGRALMLPYTNLGKWYRTPEEKAEWLPRFTADGRAARDAQWRLLPYGVWLPGV